MSVKTIEGNTSVAKGLVANGGGVAEKEYSNNYSKIECIIRPTYRLGEATKVVRTAKKYVGYLEKKNSYNLDNFTANAGYNNYTMFAPYCREKTNSTIFANGVKWCAIFVAYTFIYTFGADRARELIGGWSAYTPTMANMFLKAGGKKVPISEATYGDIIFFKNSQRICHVGIVTNGYKVTAATDKNFAYSQTEFIDDVCKVLNVATVKSALSRSITLSEKKNSNHILVLYVQKRLKDLGYYDGVPDREFGPLTTKAVNRYQKEVLKYKSVDGEITKKKGMWKSLLGLS